MEDRAHNHFADFTVACHQAVAGDDPYLRATLHRLVDEFCDHLEGPNDGPAGPGAYDETWDFPGRGL